MGMKYVLVIADPPQFRNSRAMAHKALISSRFVYLTTLHYPRFYGNFITNVAMELPVGSGRQGVTRATQASLPLGNKRGG